MSFISYAQNYEDVLLWRALKHIPKGFYLDVGACDPIYDSVTKSFYEKGWRGINIEPVPSLVARLREDRPKDINLNCAAGEKNTTQSLLESSVRGWATLSPEIQQELVNDKYSYKEYSVHVRSLTDICLEYRPQGDIHFLKIDVEGSEAEVLKGMDFKQFRPWVLLIESVSPRSQKENYEHWDQLVIDAQYQLVYRDGLNRFYLAHEHAHLAHHFQLPPNVFDEFTRFSEISIRNQCQQAELKANTARQQAKEDKVQIIQANIRAQRLEAENNYLFLSVHRAEAKYLSIANARFWRMTFPLRWIGIKIKTALKPLIKHGMHFITSTITSHPKILQWTSQTLKMFPKMARKLRSLRKIIHHQREKDRNPLFCEAPHSQALGLQSKTDPTSKTEQFDTNHTMSQIQILYYVDHVVGFLPNTGLQRVTRKIANALQAMGTAIIYVKWSIKVHNFVLVNQKELKHLSTYGGPPYDEREVMKIGYPKKNDIIQINYENMKAPERWILVPEVTYINDQARDLTAHIIHHSHQNGFKTAFLFYDDIPLKRIELRQQQVFHESYMSNLADADLILPISDYSKEQYVSFLKAKNAFDPNHQIIKTLHLAAEFNVIPNIRKPRWQEFYILSVGSIAERKNQLKLIAAFNEFSRKNPTAPWYLMLAGHVQSNLELKLTALIRENPKVIMVRDPSDEDLIAAYLHCAFTVFPSLEEGFGLPIIESLWFEKPCICADFGSMAEVGQEPGCVLIDTRSQSELETAITKLIHDKEYRAQLTHQTKAAKIKSWPNYASELLEVLIQPKEKQMLICKISPNKNRIFWLGMHKVLIKTELKRLRVLGYEVYNPPYLSEIVDQSAELNWESNQQTTLPDVIFDKLSETQFFYAHTLEPDIVSILNDYFNVIIVTISPSWLASIAPIFQGSIIYRVYGQTHSLTRELSHLRVQSFIENNPRFFFMPHAAEAVINEAPWLRKQEYIVPYCLTDDVFGYIDSWSGVEKNNGEVALSCPNISNSFYAKHFKYLKKHFNADFFRMYGVQPRVIPDPAVVGTLPREQFLQALSNSACYMYTYDDPRTCYLPPIEAMTMGMPVLFKSGCLLDKYFNGENTPARFETEEQALSLIKRIKDKDSVLINEIISHQHLIRKRYQPAHVWPIFDEIHHRLIKN